MESVSSAAAPRGVCLVPQQYETPLYPCGCIFKIVLLSTHGDPFYVGLGGIEVADAEGRVMALDPDQAPGRRPPADGARPRGRQ